MTLHFDGKKDQGRRDRLEASAGPTETGELDPASFRAYRKTVLTFAQQIDEPFEVDTLEGLHSAKAGDYLAVGAHGEMYPIDRKVFESSYELVIDRVAHENPG